MVEIRLNPDDTSEFWVTRFDPVANSNFEYLFDSYFKHNSFPINADSVIISSSSGEIQTFRRRKDEFDQNVSSIFNGTAYVQSDLESEYELSPILYVLDSIKLGLK